MFRRSKFGLLCVFIASAAASAAIRPVDVLTAYDVASIRDTYQGEGQTIAVFGSTNSAYVGLQADLDAFSTKYVEGGRSATLTYYNATPLSGNGVSGAVKSVTNTTSSSELSMDVEYAHFIAPKAKVVVVMADSSATAAQYAAAALGARTFTTSYAFYETRFDQATVNGYNARFAAADVGGMSAFSAVGDSSHYDYPASSPNVVGVGGTNVYLTASGGRNNEISWSVGGGGQSIFNAEPAWQYGVQSSGWRQGPDVSITGGGVSVVPIIVGGVERTNYGTSLSSPLWAGIGTLVQEARAKNGRPPLGTTDLLTLLYGTYKTPDYARLFYDVTASPTSGVILAGPGFDQVTGLGTPNVAAIVNYLATADVPEPSTLALAAVPFGLLARRGRR